MSYIYQFSYDLTWMTQAVQTSWQMPDTPFMQFTFWQALVDTRTIGEGSDWTPVFIQILDNQQLVAVMPVFVKAHHQGEYVFDYSWAEAYHRYGKNYYPRLVTSVPFTPVTGERVWLIKGQMLSQAIWRCLLSAVDELAKLYQASTWHGLFISNQEAGQLAKQDGIVQRLGCQFLWQNRNLEDKWFVDFEDFLAILTAKKRKSIRIERQKVVKQQLRCQLKLGHELTKEDWQVFYQCYAMTYLVRGRQPYLTLAFFEQIWQTMAVNLMMAQAIDEHGDIVACSLFFYDTTTLYGRYWGCLAEYDCLHFELCYYQGIEFAIQQRLQYFDPGTQGEHKLIRGFAPILTQSVHRIYDQLFKPAIADFCQQEQQAVLAYQQDALAALPFNQTYKERFF